MESVVNQELVKSIDTCARQIVEVERKVLTLKTELAQTVAQLRGQTVLPTAATGVTGLTGTTGFTPQVAGVPSGVAPGSFGTGFQGYPSLYGYGLPQGTGFGAFGSTVPTATTTPTLPTSGFTAPWMQPSWSGFTGTLPWLSQPSTGLPGFTGVQGFGGYGRESLGLTAPWLGSFYGSQFGSPFYGSQFGTPFYGSHLGSQVASPFYGSHLGSLFGTPYGSQAPTALPSQLPTLGSGFTGFSGIGQGITPFSQGFLHGASPLSYIW